MQATDIDQAAYRRKLREASVAFGLERDRTHWVTLNTNRELSSRDAEARLRRWRVELMRRLHGRNFYMLSHEERFEFIGAPELTGYGHPHFHLACSVPQPVRDRFIRHAERRWLDIVPSATCHIEEMGATRMTRWKVLTYGMKGIDRNSSVIDSRLYQYSSPTT